ncbi:MAG: hypothetical protein R3308_05470, partial [Thiohalobacterales bacterium]|nr:hypothetical protein [Thiohalobacterales bacterium]
GEGVLLWEEYVAEALALEQQFGAHAIRVRYEDFLAEPVSQLARLAEFAGLDAGDDKLQAAAAQVNPQRRYAFMHDEALLPVYHDCRQRDLVKALGYDRLDDDACNTAA